MPDSSESPSPSWFPYDVAMNILARVSRLDHAALSLASKNHLSLVASSDLYKMRSLMCNTETYVYVCLRIPQDPKNPRWYILRPRKTLIPIPSLPSQPSEASSVVVLDLGIYVIGGLIKGKRTSKVWFLDCRTHKWLNVASMDTPRANAVAKVIDGKIYVLGGYKFEKDTSWGEVYDPKTQSWDSLKPLLDRKHIYNNVMMNDQNDVFAVDGIGRRFYYSPKEGPALEGTCGRGNYDEFLGTRMDWCMIDDLLYCCGFNGKMYWCELDELNLKEVKGLDCLKKSLCDSRLVHFGKKVLNRWDKQKRRYIVVGKGRFGSVHELVDLLSGAKLSNCGGNNVIFWDVIVGENYEIWCAEISLERRDQGGEIWGNIEWSNVVMSVDSFLDRYKVLYSVSVTI